MRGETVIRLDCQLSRQGQPSCNEFFVLPILWISVAVIAAAVVILALTMGGGAAGGGVGY